MKTIYAKEAQFDRRWYVIDAEDQVLGRLASEVARLLMGKHKPIYAPHQELGDYIIVINAEKVRVTGNKMQNKMYYRHSGYVGSLKQWNLADAFKRKPTFPIEHAIRGMLPKNKLGRTLFQNVKVYAGSDHPHKAQKPEPRQLSKRGY